MLKNQNESKKTRAKCHPSHHMGEKLALERNRKLVKGFLDKPSARWLYVDNYNEARGVYVISGYLGGFDGLFSTYHFYVFVKADTVQSYAISPISARMKRNEVSEFLTRANYGMKYGNFEMDWDDGEVRFHLLRSAVSLENDTDNVMKQLLQLPASMMHKYISGLFAVIRGEKTPHEAIDAIEK